MSEVYRYIFKKESIEELIKKIIGNKLVSIGYSRGIIDIDTETELTPVEEQQILSTLQGFNKEVVYTKERGLSKRKKIRIIYQRE